MVKQLYQQMTTEQQRARIDFSVGRLPEAQADPTLIQQVWMNLLDNAVKYSSKKPRASIKITGNDAGDEIVYSVSDNGAGFNMDYRDKLFGLFQRLHSFSEFEGTGVGLAIVQRIIRRHGGRVWAQGEEQKGAVFCFSLKKEVASDETGDR
jgi:light-regulated signal transduction histidine kinase (bacteriophytochrome)